MTLSKSNYLSKVPFPNTTTLGLELQYMNFEVSNHSIHNNFTFMSIIPIFIGLFMFSLLIRLLHKWETSGFWVYFRSTSGFLLQSLQVVRWGRGTRLAGYRLWLWIICFCPLQLLILWFCCLSLTNILLVLIVGLLCHKTLGSLLILPYRKLLDYMRVGRSGRKMGVLSLSLHVTPSFLLLLHPFPMFLAIYYKNTILENMVRFIPWGLRWNFKSLTIIQLCICIYWRILMKRIEWNVVLYFLFPGTLPNFHTGK